MFQSKRFIANITIKSYNNSLCITMMVGCKKLVQPTFCKSHLRVKTLDWRCYRAVSNQLLPSGKDIKSVHAVCIQTENFAFWIDVLTRVSFSVESCYSQVLGRRVKCKLLLWCLYRGSGQIYKWRGFWKICACFETGLVLVNSNPNADQYMGQMFAPEQLSWYFSWIITT